MRFTEEQIEAQRLANVRHEREREIEELDSERYPASREAVEALIEAVGAATRLLADALESEKDARLNGYGGQTDEWIGEASEAVASLAALATSHDCSPHIESSDEGTSYCRLCETIARIGEGS